MELACLETEPHYEEINKYTTMPKSGQSSEQSSDLKEHLGYSTISCPGDYLHASPTSCKPPLLTTATNPITTTTTSFQYVTAACPAYGLTGPPPALDPVYDMPLMKSDLSESFAEKSAEVEPEYEIMKSLESFDKIP